MQMIGAALTIPMMPTPAMAVAKPAAVAVPSQARYWAIYMNSLHGECTPRALQTMLNITPDQATSYLNQLVADGVVKAHPMAKMMVQNQGTSGKFVQDIKTRIKDRLNAVLEEDTALDAGEETPVEDPETPAVPTDTA